MVRSKENGISVAPFLVKCYEMVSDETTDDLISWNESSSSSSSFVIWDESKFCSQLLPKYFKHSNFSSFVRQLNIYGFRKVDTDRWEFENQSFIKGHKHLLNNITRRKQPPHTLLLQQKHVDADAHADAEKRRTALWKEVENLKNDKNALTQELINLRQHQETSQSKLLLLREQFKGVEKNQQQMLSFIVMAMQRPELFAQFLHPKENHNNNNNNWRVRVPKTGKNKKLSDTRENCEPISSDGMIVRYQPPSIQEDSVFAVDSDSDDLMGLDFTSDEMRDLLMDIDLLFGPPQENLHSSDNDGQFIRPDMIPENDDTMLDQLLFSSPKEYEQYPKLDNASSSSMNTEPDAFNLVDTSENVVEALTEQMVFLSPEMK